jgi:hypothetical protein
MRIDALQPDLDVVGLRRTCALEILEYAYTSNPTDGLMAALGTTRVKPLRLKGLNSAAREETFDEPPRMCEK